MKLFTKDQAKKYLESHGWKFVGEQGHTLARVDEYRLFVTIQATGQRVTKGNIQIPHDENRLLHSTWVQYIATIEGRDVEAVLSDIREEPSVSYDKGYQDGYDAAKQELPRLERDAERDAIIKWIEESDGDWETADGNYVASQIAGALRDGLHRVK